MRNFDRHKGRLLTVSSKPVERIEGDWPKGGIVLMELTDLATAKARKDDPDYIGLARIRQATASTNLVLVEGI
ncbi:DUF1330 domain-containing protein [Ruegeria sp. YS9]|uniref:DUF1330 domain-containing protein n=1 Tax=Ruegeria sp. YS9 TaxID=2966453 RepID=UPI00214D0EFD|nr:DUF1330 domain-containing protein [Ruegeria sp. YS9]UUV05116.1 DUF1330 domain-containing protein [Ruegeria sp. YS9]